MEQESTFNNKKIGIIGSGPSGCICASFLSGYDVTIFDKGQFLRTILPTGGTRCNLANAIFDFKELASNYPRGERFLYSVFSRFGTQDSINYFKTIGVETYIQENDNRIFPVANSSKFVQEKLLQSLNCKKISDEIIKIKKDKKFILYSKTKEYKFDYVVIAIGGHSDFQLISELGINIIKPVPSLVALRTESDFSSISGVSLKNICVKLDEKKYFGDLLFTHKGVSGPVIYKISSIYARKEFPYTLDLKLLPDIDIQEILNKNPHKQINNLLSEFIPKSSANYLLNQMNIPVTLEACKINREIRDKIINTLNNYPVKIISHMPDGEVVTCGGVNLSEVNPKTLESKSIKNLHFCGEVLDIDGFCGGFNLQNCWSNGYIAAQSIIEKIIQQS